MNSQDELLRVKALVKKNELEKALRAAQSEMESKRKDFYSASEKDEFELALADAPEGMEALEEKVEAIQAQIKLLQKFLDNEIDLNKEIDYQRNIDIIDAKAAVLRLEERENREPLGEIHQLKALLGA